MKGRKIHENIHCRCCGSRADGGRNRCFRAKFDVQPRSNDEPVTRGLDETRNDEKSDAEEIDDAEVEPKSEADEFDEPGTQSDLGNETARLVRLPGGLRRPADFRLK